MTGLWTAPRRRGSAGSAGVVWDDPAVSPRPTRDRRPGWVWRLGPPAVAVALFLGYRIVTDGGSALDARTMVTVVVILVLAVVLDRLVGRYVDRRDTTS